MGEPLTNKLEKPFRWFKIWIWNNYRNLGHIVPHTWNEIRIGIFLLFLLLLLSNNSYFRYVHIISLNHSFRQQVVQKGDYNDLIKSKKRERDANNMAVIDVKFCKWQQQQQSKLELNTEPKQIHNLHSNDTHDTPTVYQKTFPAKNVRHHENT